MRRSTHEGVIIRAACEMTFTLRIAHKLSSQQSAVSNQEESGISEFPRWQNPLY